MADKNIDKSQDKLKQLNNVWNTQANDRKTINNLFIRQWTVTIVVKNTISVQIDHNTLKSQRIQIFKNKKMFIK